MVLTFPVQVREHCSVHFLCVGFCVQDESSQVRSLPLRPAQSRKAGTPTVGHLSQWPAGSHLSGWLAARGPTDPAIHPSCRPSHPIPSTKGLGEARRLVHVVLGLDGAGSF